MNPKHWSGGVQKRYLPLCWFPCNKAPPLSHSTHGVDLLLRLCTEMISVSKHFSAVELIKLHSALWIVSLVAVLFQKAGVCRACSTSEGLLLCRSCGHEVAFERDVSFVPSRLALSHRNNTVLGERRITVQLFENPQGFQFEVVTLKNADVLKHWPADRHFTWFPGFAWTVATCPRCKTHLGWAFQPSDWPPTVTRQDFEDSDQTFVALIVQRLLQEQFASTLLMTPNSFRS